MPRTIDAPPTDAAPRPDSRAATGELVERIMAEFHVAIRELRCAGTERLMKAGVSMTHLHVLGLLSRYGETTMSRLADLLDVSLSNATGLIDRMEERGLVVRARVADDRRVVLVGISDEGQAKLDELEIVRRGMLEKILDRLEPAQLERLARCIDDVQDAVSGLIADEGFDALTAAHLSSHEHPPANGLGRSVPH